MSEKKHIWMSEDEACDYLRCDKTYLMDLVTKKEIPHSVLPHSYQIRFNSDRLDEWLLSLETFSKQQEALSLEDNEKLFMEEVFILFEREGFTRKEKSRYTNFYMGSRVRAQLHKAKTGSFSLVIPEDDYLPQFEHLPIICLEDLSGFWGANKDWLLGNSKRFTHKPAKAYLLPDDMHTNFEHPAWIELKKIILIIIAHI